MTTSSPRGCQRYGGAMCQYFELECSPWEGEFHREFHRAYVRLVHLGWVSVTSRRWACMRCCSSHLFQSSTSYLHWHERIRITQSIIRYLTKKYNRNLTICFKRTNMLWTPNWATCHITLKTNHPFHSCPASWIDHERHAFHSILWRHWLKKSFSLMKSKGRLGAYDMKRVAVGALISWLLGFLICETPRR